MFLPHHLLSSLSWFLGMTEVVAAAAIFEDEDVALLEVDVIFMEADRVPLRRDLNNVGIVGAVITSLKSVRRNLIDLSGHNYLILVLLPRVVILRSLLPLFLALPQLYCRRSMIDSAS